MSRFVSIRWKFGLLLGAMVFAIVGLDGWLVPERAAEAEREALRQRAQAEAAILGDSVVAALEFEQIDAARESLTAALADPLVEWAAIYDRNGARMAAVGSGSMAHVRAGRGSTDLQVDDRRIVSLAPIGSEENRIGSVAVAIRSNLVAQRREQTRVAVFIQGLIVGGLGLALAIFLLSRMTSQILQVQRAAEQIARGDVSMRVEVQSNDEVGVMAACFEQMNDRLRALQHAAVRVADGDLGDDIGSDIEGDGELFTSVRQMLDSLRNVTRRVSTSADRVADAAAGMFATVREQETLATQQTGSLEEIRRTLETLASAADAVSRDARSVNDMARRTLESSQRMAEHTRLVSAHSDRIGEILSLIQDIADRSDLLALNAALEGTKAGEVGRGFSLVAAEMRRLSEHVMDSVRDIRKLVADMREASHSSVLATEESTKLAREAAAASAQISEAVQRHQEGTSQAKGAAEEVVRAVNESLDGSVASTRSAESLLQLSAELRSTISAFRLDAVAGEGSPG